MQVETMIGVHENDELSTEMSHKIHREQIEDLDNKDSKKAGIPAHGKLKCDRRSDLKLARLDAYHSPPHKQNHQT